MAGQGIERRRVLQIMGTAAAAAQFPVFSKWAFACGHASKLTAEIRPAAYRPQFFTDPEYATVERLAEIIIPSDRTPGAKEAGVSEFIDFMVSRDADAQYGLRTGLTWMSAHCKRIFGKSFLELSPAQQIAVLEPLAYKEKARPGKEDGRKFFRLMREFTVTGFYTSKIGYQELDHPALKFYDASPECPHQDDPEHLHLTHAHF